MITYNGFKFDIKITCPHCSLPLYGEATSMVHTDMFVVSCHRYINVSYTCWFDKENILVEMLKINNCTIFNSFNSMSSTVTVDKDHKNKLKYKDFIFHLPSVVKSNSEKFKQMMIFS